MNRKHHAMGIGVVAMFGLVLLRYSAGVAPAQSRDDAENKRRIREGQPPGIREPARSYPEGGEKPIPWTEAELSPDVFERPRFLSALSATLNANYALIGVRSGIRVDEGKIDRERIDAMKSAISTVFQPAVVPRGWRGMEIYGKAVRFKPWPAGMPEPAGNVRELDLTVPIEHLEPTDRFYAEWSSGGIKILTVGSSARLKLPPERRMKISPKPRDFVERHNNQQYFWDFFDRKALHSLLTTVFQVPYKTEDDFILEGYTQELEGVRCLFGRLQSREAYLGGRHGHPKPPPAWWDRISIFVTDSDPQYFCVGIEFPSASDLTIRRAPAGE
ncbi:MAG: hypothetical protein HY287_16330 [Planctomycetes bacterium]|nr:hypothetical protein [Planctomycetota bacterium]MBI3835894.1 hypothetical protein [Planctomycetota bacterium]